MDSGFLSCPGTIWSSRSTPIFRVAQTAGSIFFSTIYCRGCVASDAWPTNEGIRTTLRTYIQALAGAKHNFVTLIALWELVGGLLGFVQTLRVYDLVDEAIVSKIF